MHRLLIELQASMNTMQEEIISAVVPLLKLLSLTVIGLILAHHKTQIIPKATFKLLSKLVFALFLPCLIFIDLGRSITLRNLFLWWFVPVNVVVSMLLGFLLGVVVVLLCRPPPQFRRFTIVMTACGNTGNLPIAILGSLCHSEDNPFGPNCHQRGVAYVSIAQWISVVLVYTLVYHMMEPPVEYYEIVEEENVEGCGGGGGGGFRPLVVEAEWPPGVNETEISTKPFKDYSRNENDEEIQGIENRTEPISSKMVKKVRLVAEKTPIKNIFQPPTIASLLAIIIGSIPHAKSFVFGRDAPLSFITDSLEILGGAMVPSVMLVLGGMLAEGPYVSKLGLKTTVGVIVARLLVLPVFGIGVVGLADKMHLLITDDAMYRYVLLLQYATPSAILLGAVARMRGYAVSEASALLFWQHVFALFSLSFYIFAYSKLVSVV
ncbi:putative membrane transport protein [Helianthus debilis subsp. tardiflorus]